MKKIIIIIFIFFLVVTLTGCVNKKDNTKIEKTKKADYEWEKLTLNSNDYNFDDADKEEIINIFEHLGFYHTFKDDIATDSDNEYLWGLTFKNLYNEMKTIENSNKFASLYIKEADKVDINNYSDLEIDFFDSYMKILFAYINSSEVSSTIKVNDLLDVERLGKVTKVYTQNYNSDNNSENSNYYRLILYYFKKQDTWIKVLSTDLGAGGDGNYVHFYDEVDFPDGHSFDEMKPDIINNVIKQNYDYFNFLIQYRNKVYLNYVNKKINDYNNDTNKKYKPEVGMTEKEVLNSTWGTPNKRNKDTYSWGTEEQWVYNKKGYIYFKNGIVTSISER